MLEYDEVKLLTELDDLLAKEDRLDIEVFSLGSYSNPTQNADYMRSVIPKGRFYPELYNLAMKCDKDFIHPSLVEWADVILSMHNYKVPGQKNEQPWLANNWKLFKEKQKKIVWRSIGQSNHTIEKELKQYVKEGLKIIRYSPLERNIPEYAGENAMIRFYKDKEEFNNWTGEKKQVITIAQSYKKRGEHLGYHLFEKITHGFNRKVYGTENADLGELNGGQRSYEELKQNLRESRVFYYFGTQPAPYTLSFIEALMIGIPIVAVGEKLRKNNNYNWPNYEIPQIINNGFNGYLSDNIDELRGYIQLLLEDDDVAKRISEAGRSTALKLFSRDVISKEWIEFLKAV